MSWTVDNHVIENADQLLRLYVETDEEHPRMPELIEIRDQLLENLDSVESAAEVTGLIHWCIRDKGVNTQGETLDETAERLADIDIEADSDQYTDLIFQIKMAIERLDDIMLENM